MSADRILTRAEAAIFLREMGSIYSISSAGLAKLACTGSGPKMFKFGRRVGYREVDLREWGRARTRIVTTTSDPGADLS